MQFVITGGGTGGHVYPAIAAANGIRERWPESPITFIGTRGRTEATAVPAAGYPIEFIKAAGLYHDPVRLAAFFTCNGIGVLQSMGILSRLKPVAVVGSGGFVSAPVLMAAKILKIPYIVLEQNVVPGKVNRMMAKGAAKILATFEGVLPHLPKDKTIVTGNPVRQEILTRTREEAMARLNLKERDFNLIITGASQGAKSINDAVIASLPRWKEKNWNVLHLTGPKNFDEVNSAAKEIAESFAGEYRPIAYTEDMASILASADLTVARSGATTLSELFIRGLPSILIPYPHHKDQHGIKNARWVESEGGATVIPDSEAVDKLADTVIKLEADRSRLQKMGQNSKKLAKPDALKIIVDEVEKIIHRQ